MSRLSSRILKTFPCSWIKCLEYKNKLTYASDIAFGFLGWSVLHNNLPIAKFIISGDALSIIYSPIHKSLKGISSRSARALDWNCISSRDVDRRRSNYDNDGRSCCCLWFFLGAQKCRLVTILLWPFSRNSPVSATTTHTTTIPSTLPDARQLTVFVVLPLPSHLSKHIQVMAELQWPLNTSGGSWVLSATLLFLWWLRQKWVHHFTQTTATTTTAITIFVTAGKDTRIAVDKSSSNMALPVLLSARPVLTFVILL